MWITYSVLLCKLVTCFSTFSIFILSGKYAKSLWSSCNFSSYWTSTLTKYPSTHSSISLFMKSSLNWEVSSIQSKLLTGSFCDIAQPYKLKEVLQNLNNKFLNTFSWRFRKHQPSIMHHFEDRHHNICQNFLFQSFFKNLFVCM